MRYFAHLSQYQNSIHELFQKCVGAKENQKNQPGDFYNNSAEF